MVGVRRWSARGVLGLGLALAPTNVGAGALRGLEAVETPGGAAVRLRLTGGSPAVVRSVPAAAGATGRLVVDLPPGTQLGPGVAAGARAVPPLTRVRAGLADGGTVRVVLDLEGPFVYRVRQGDGLVTLELTGLRDRGEPRAEGRRGAAGLTPPRGPVGPPKIVIDPGHGGTDPGARGYAIEKDVTLAIARRLATLLRERRAAEVVLTRTGDTTLSLAERTARANAEGADLFVSIHANAAESSRRHGVETYYLDNTNDHASMRLAAMENGLDLLAPPAGQADLRYILSDLVQVGKMEESIALATALQRELVGQLGARYPRIVDLGVKRGPFYVLVGAYMPCVLVETSFLTHPGDGRRLATPRYRAAVAEGLYRGIARFLADTRRTQTL